MCDTQMCVYVWGSHRDGFGKMAFYTKTQERFFHSNIFKREKSDSDALRFSYLFIHWLVKDLSVASAEGTVA